MNSFSKNSIVWLIEWVPMSLIKVIGQPNIVTMFSYMNFDATSFVHDSTS